MDFKKFKTQMQQHFQLFLAGQNVLFLTDVSKEAIWDAYLLAFPEEEQQGFNCNACKQFLRPYGNIVSIVNNKIVSIWDFECDEPYQTVVKSLNNLVISAPIRDRFVTKFAKLGTDFNHQHLESGEVITWNHFHIVLPQSFVTKSSFSEDSLMGTFRTQKETFKRALDTITIDALETVIDLIHQNSLYRGQESLGMITNFLAIKRTYTLLRAEDRDNYCWANAATVSGAISGIRNTSIGTLLVDISEGKELDVAVGAFERIMAPANYKRPNAILTNKMIADAQARLEVMGLTDSLGRRYAVLDDITVNNVLFVNRDTKKAMNVFDDLSKDVAVNPKKLGKTEEIGIEDFITNVLPTAKNIEMIIENAQTGNFMSLIAPTVKDSKPLFKWDNAFSWTYANNVADSIKERVKAAGGNVDGVLRFSIQWNEDGLSRCDFDAHAIEPNGIEIAFDTYKGHKTTMSGMLDVDMIRPIGTGVENITWSHLSSMRPGVYTFFIRNYDNGPNTGFQAQIAFGNEVYNFSHDKRVTRDMKVAKVEFKNGVFTLIPTLSSTEGSVISKDVWSVKTNQFQKVNMIMASPNHWDDKTVGNKHYFFILDGCKNPDTPRGFFNEYLKDELMAEKRVFEALGGKMKVAPSDDQLSGVGFSTTVRNSIICKVEGTFNRILKINF